MASKKINDVRRVQSGSTVQFRSLLFISAQFLVTRLVTKIGGIFASNIGFRQALKQIELANPLNAFEHPQTVRKRHNVVFFVPNCQSFVSRVEH